MINWQEQSSYQLNKNEINIWRVNLADFSDQLSSLKNWLDQDERQRADRFHFKKDHDNFVVSHGILRLILASYLNTQPQHLVFEKTSHGKPFLKDHLEIKFNLSHSGQMLLFAMGLNHELGVDIECIDKKIEYDDLAHRFFTSIEAKTIASFSGEQKKQAFFKVWTQKEAFVKAIGLGLSFSLKKFVVDANPEQPGQLLEIHEALLEEQGWKIETFNVTPNYLAALATHTTIAQFKFFQFDKAKLG